MLDWFEKLFGFREEEYFSTQEQFEFAGEILTSRVNGTSFRAGRFYTPSIAELRLNVGSDTGPSSVTHEVIGDALLLHANPSNSLDMFQVASQFNALEFISPSSVPEDGITGYDRDPTQGPACSLAAAAGTVFRNYFLDLGDQIGQTRLKQLNNLEFLESSLFKGPYWRVRNGYVESDSEALGSFEAEVAVRPWNDLVGAVRIGLQERTQVTFAQRFEPLDSPHLVNQAFCSAVSCAYSHLPVERWKSLAQISLDAAYEGTLLSAVMQRDAGIGSGRVWLTFIGGGVFGNDDSWIYAAIERAIKRVANLGLDIRICHYGRLAAPFKDLKI